MDAPLVTLEVDAVVTDIEVRNAPGKLRRVTMGIVWRRDETLNITALLPAEAVAALTKKTMDDGIPVKIRFEIG